jgi:hypothetical protein
MDRYNCPDLFGIETAAFCAGVMLYKILTGTHPYPAADIYQDMREGVFLPLNLGAPHLNEKLSSLIKLALLLPVASKKTTKTGTDILMEMLEILMGKEGNIVAFSSLFNTLPAEKIKRIENERKQFVFRQGSLIKTKRFIIRNKYFLVITALILVFAIFIFVNTRKASLTTEGMTAEEVVFAYYNAFSLLDDEFMRACIQGADRSDITAAGIIHVIVKQRQFYEMSSGPILFPAQEWLDNGGELPSPHAFGVTNLEVEKLTKRWDGGELDGNIVVYRASYTLWSPTDAHPFIRSDELTLRLDRHNNWRIIEILRTER